MARGAQGPPEHGGDAAVQVPPQPEKTPTENSAAPRSETPAESGSDEADPENPGRHRSGDKAVSVSELLARHRDDALISPASCAAWCRTGSAR
ncbi:hypothetical protein GS436_19315 [Rhodococcus hoagii]|nr:hypothetical protein [Prescottella equi]